MPSSSSSWLRAPAGPARTRVAVVVVARTWWTAALALALAACGAVDHPQPEVGVEDTPAVFTEPEGGVDAHDGATRDDGDAAPDARPPTCQDSDGDGFGVDCAMGPDCDDLDPHVTNECYRCLQPATACPCTEEGSSRTCDVVTDSDVPSPDGTCHLGLRTCVDGAWTRCTAIEGFTRTIVPPAQCNICSPMCRATTVCPDSLSDLAGSSSGLVLGSNPASTFCPTASRGGIQLPDSTGTGVGVAGGASGSTAGCTVVCGGVCCGAMQSCLSLGTSGTAASCPAGSGTGITSTNQTCGLACAAGTTHCGDAPADQCCGSGQTCHSGACVLGNPSNCMRDADCPLYSTGQRCFSFGVCSTGTNSAGSCPCTNPPNNGCFTSARAGGFQEVDDIFNTNDGRDVRRLRFAHYLRGLSRSPTSSAPCNNSNDCPVGRSVRSTSATDPYPCTSCTPVSAAAFQGFAPANKDWATVAPFLDALDWQWVDFVRYNASGTPDTSGSNEVPWNGLIFDLQVPANQVALFGIRNNGSDCCSQGMEFQVWMTNNPGATTVAASGTIDPNQWNLTTFQRMYTEGWTRNPLATASPSDTSNLEDATTNGNAVADAYTTVWTLPSGCVAMRYAAVNVGNMSQPSSSCSTGRVANRLDAVAGLDANGYVPAIYHTLPYGVSAGPDAISATARIQAADIYLLVDSTSSMSQEVTALRASLSGTGGVVGCTFATGGLVGAARCIVPDPWFGVGAFQDFPVSPYGASSDTLFRNLFDLSSDSTALQTAINTLSTGNGGDSPDAQIPALWSVITGLGASTNASYLADRTSCPAGRFGYPCFRSSALPVVVLYTDSSAHNGAGDTNLYDDAVLRGSAVTYPAPVAVAGNEDRFSPYLIPSETAPFVATGNTAGMRDDNATPCAYHNGARDAVFRLNVTARRSVVFDTIGSGFDTTLYVYKSDGTLIACNDDYSGLDSRIAVALDPGTYYIWVDGYASASGAYTFRYGPMPTPRFNDTVNALNAAGAKVIVIDSCGTSGCAAQTTTDANALANGTGSRTGTGAASVYTIADDGTNIGATTVTALSALLTNFKMDVSAAAVDNPATAGVDERCFVNNPAGTAPGTVRLSSTALGEPAPYPTGQCASTGSTPAGVGYVAQQCNAGVAVNFRADFRNNCVRPSNVDQTFTFDIVVRGNGVTELERVPVTIVVPRSTVPATGTYSYVVNGTGACSAVQQISWDQLITDATIPAGTSIRVDVRTASSTAGLPTAPWVLLGTITTAPPPALPLGGTISAALRAAAQPFNQSYLEVRFTLSSDPTRSLTPVLSGYRVQFTCNDNT